MSASRQPVLFVGHGSPMNAIEDNEWSRGFADLGKSLSTPTAILAVSAHWYVPGIFTTGDQHPKTIHDFGGFPKALFDMEYPAAGDLRLAARVIDLVGANRASLSNDWGLDHGTWTILHHIRPRADVPVVQLSIDTRLSAAEHLAVGRSLRALRDEGVLIIGSGNVTHNLRQAMTAFQRGDNSVPSWAQSFDSELSKAALQHDGPALTRLLESETGRMSHPTPDHYLPVLYAAGAADERDAVSFPIDGWTGSLSMRSIRFG